MHLFELLYAGEEVMSPSWHLHHYASHTVSDAPAEVPLSSPPSLPASGASNWASLVTAHGSCGTPKGVGSALRSRAVETHRV